MGKQRAVGLLLAACVTMFGGCGVPPETLVPAPLLYTLGFEPSEHAERYEPQVEVFFATSRAPSAAEGQYFGNAPSSDVRAGRALLTLCSDRALTRDALEQATTRVELDEPVVFRLDEVMTDGIVATVDGLDWEPHNLAEENARRLREAVEATPDRSLLVFVDGTKGNFYRSCALAAEARHLLGRQIPVLVYAWPSHQNIFSYIFGGDEARADAAGLTFAALMDWVIDHSGAERIDVLSYSAGGRVASIGLSHLRQRHANLTGPALREQLPIGTVFFAAADEPAHRFAQEVHDIHEFVDRIVVTISKRDHALRLSRLLKGEGQRLGNESSDGLTPVQFQILREAEHVEFVDVSYGMKERGFKIRGHSYWYRQPWVVSDVIMALRTGLPGDQRGLTSEAISHVYALTAEYPERLTQAAAPHFPSRDRP